MSCPKLQPWLNTVPAPVVRVAPRVADVSLVEVTRIVTGVSGRATPAPGAPGASTGDLTLVDRVVVVAPAVLPTPANTATGLLLLVLPAVGAEERGGAFRDVLVLLALVGRALAVVVLAVSAGGAHRLVVAEVHGGAHTAVSLVVVILF